MNILLMAGGWSGERQVALNGAKQIREALRRLGHNVTDYDPQESFNDLHEAVKGQDFVFINLHGSPGEDGLPQAMLDNLGIPYQGSGPAASLLALNKAATKTIFRWNKLETPDWVLLTNKPEAGWLAPFPFPLFIKSNTGGSSLGLARVDDPKDLTGVLDTLHCGVDDLIVEPACPGMDLTCGVLGTLPEEAAPEHGKRLKEEPIALPPILIRPLLEGRTFFDYESKYAEKGAEELCPAPVAPEISLEAQRVALAAHKALGLSGYSRSDFILSPEGKLHLLEVNTLPGMTSTSLLPKEAAAIGLSFDQLIERLIQLGFNERG